MLTRYDLLDDTELHQIHHAALEILTRMGVMIDHPGALEHLSEAGATVDFSRRIAYLPPEMIARALAQAPKEFTCCGRSEAFDVAYSARRRVPALRSGAGCIRAFDSNTQKVRSLNRRDSLRSAAMADALENVSVCGTMTPHDLPPPTYDVHTLKDMLINNRKHIWALTTSSENLRFQLELMAAVAGGEERLAQRPLCSGIFCMMAPMHIPHDEIERLLLYGRYNLPVRMTVIPVRGASAPYTLAGTLTSINAQFLGALAVQQTLCPGQPTWYYASVKAMDMKTTVTVPNATPESLLLTAAVAQLARFYNLPSEMALMSFPGCQMHQFMFYLGSIVQWAMLAGLNGIGSTGNFDSSNVWSPEAVVLADEAVGYNRRLSEGFALDEAAMGVEAMLRVGHKGHFLADDHTLEHLRKEPLFSPRLLDWGTYDEWAQAGYKTIVERARERLQNVLKTHQVPPLELPVVTELERIAQAADKELVG